MQAIATDAIAVIRSKPFQRSRLCPFIHALLLQSCNMGPHMQHLNQRKNHVSWDFCCKVGNTSLRHVTEAVRLLNKGQHSRPVFKKKTHPPKKIPSKGLLLCLPRHRSTACNHNSSTYLHASHTVSLGNQGMPIELIYVICEARIIFRLAQPFPQPFHSSRWKLCFKITWTGGQRRFHFCFLQRRSVRLTMLSTKYSLLGCHGIPGGHYNMTYKRNMVINRALIISFGFSLVFE